MFQGEFTAFLMSTRESFSGSPVTVAMSVDGDHDHDDYGVVKHHHGSASSSKHHHQSRNSHNKHRKQHQHRQQHHQTMKKKQQKSSQTSPASSPTTMNRRRKIVGASAAPAHHAPSPLSNTTTSWLEAQREWLSNAFGTGSTGKADRHHHVNVKEANSQWQKQQQQQDCCSKDIKQCSSSSSSSNCSSRRVSFALTEDSTLPSSSSSSSRSLSSIEDDDEEKEESTTTKRTAKAEAVVAVPTKQQQDAETRSNTASVTSMSDDTSSNISSSFLFVGLKGFHQYTLAQSFWHQNKQLEALECFMKALKQQTRVSHEEVEEEGDKTETECGSLSSQGEATIKELLFQVLTRKEMAQLLLQMVVTGSHCSSSLKTPAQWRRVRQLVKEHVPLPSSLSRHSSTIALDQVSLENNDLCFHALLELQTCETLLFDQTDAEQQQYRQILNWERIQVTYLKYQLFMQQQQQQLQQALTCLLKCQALLHEYRNSFRNHQSHQQLIWMYKECGNVHYQQGDYSSAVQHYTMAQQLLIKKASSAAAVASMTATSTMSPLCCTNYYLKRRLSSTRITPCKNSMYAHVSQVYWTDDQVV